VVGALFAFLTLAFGRPIEFQDGHTEPPISAPRP